MEIKKDTVARKLTRELKQKRIDEFMDRIAEVYIKRTGENYNAIVPPGMLGTIIIGVIEETLEVVRDYEVYKMEGVSVSISDLITEENLLSAILRMERRDNTKGTPKIE